MGKIVGQTVLLRQINDHLTVREVFEAIAYHGLVGVEGDDTCRIRSCGAGRVEDSDLFKK
jgi:hypothetical protein